MRSHEWARGEPDDLLPNSSTFLPPDCVHFIQDAYDAVRELVLGDWSESPGPRNLPLDPGRPYPSLGWREQHRCQHLRNRYENLTILWIVHPVVSGVDRPACLCDGVNVHIPSIHCLYSLLPRPFRNRAYTSAAIGLTSAFVGAT